MKASLYLKSVFATTLLFLPAVGFSADNNKSSNTLSGYDEPYQEHMDAIIEDQTDDTDVLAIPFDSSDVEDQMQLQRMREAEQKYKAEHPASK
jgi:hypothetical protein